jgi:hypothetical protein
MIVVPVEDVDEVEEIDDDELARWTLFRGMNMRATSSGCIELRVP